MPSVLAEVKAVPTVLGPQPVTGNLDQGAGIPWPELGRLLTELWRRGLAWAPAEEPTGMV